MEDKTVKSCGKIEIELEMSTVRGLSAYRIC